MNIQERFKEAKKLRKRMAEEKAAEEKEKTQEEDKLAKAMAGVKVNQKKKRSTHEPKDEIEILDDLAYEVVRDYVRQDIGERLKDFREKELGLSQKKLAEAYGECQNITDTCLSKWESGKNGVDLLFLIWLSEKFHVNLHWLITGEKDTPRDKVVEELIETLESALEISKKL